MRQLWIWLRRCVVRGGDSLTFSATTLGAKQTMSLAIRFEVDESLEVHASMLSILHILVPKTLARNTVEPKKRARHWIFVD